MELLIGNEVLAHNDCIIHCALFSVQNWSPVLNRYGVSLPLECPLNLSRDLLGARESLKRARSSHWQCLKCGKKFYLERHLDLHIERRHSDIVNNVSTKNSFSFGFLL